jgi:hypothetical protein
MRKLVAIDRLVLREVAVLADELHQAGAAARSIASPAPR